MAGRVEGVVSDSVFGVICEGVTAITLVVPCGRCMGVSRLVGAPSIPSVVVTRGVVVVIVSTPSL